MVSGMFKSNQFQVFTDLQVSTLEQPLQFAININLNGQYNGLTHASTRFELKQGHQHKENDISDEKILTMTLNMAYLSRSQYIECFVPCPDKVDIFQSYGGGPEYKHNINRL